MNETNFFRWKKILLKQYLIDLKQQIQLSRCNGFFLHDEFKKWSNLIGGAFNDTTSNCSSSIDGNKILYIIEHKAREFAHASSKISFLNRLWAHTGRVVPTIANLSVVARRNSMYKTISQ